MLTWAVKKLETRLRQIVLINIVCFVLQDPKAHRNLGDVLRLSKKLEDAKESYLEALRLKPGDPLAIQYLEEMEEALEEDDKEAKGKA